MYWTFVALYSLAAGCLALFVLTALYMAAGGLQPDGDDHRSRALDAVDDAWIAVGFLGLAALLVCYLADVKDVAGRPAVHAAWIWTIGGGTTVLIVGAFFLNGLLEHALLSASRERPMTPPRRLKSAPVDSTGGYRPPLRQTAGVR